MRTPIRCGSMARRWARTRSRNCRWPSATSCFEGNIVQGTHRGGTPVALCSLLSFRRSNEGATMSQTTLVRETEVSFTSAGRTIRAERFEVEGLVATPPVLLLHGADGLARRG